MTTFNYFNSSCTDRNGNAKRTYTSYSEAEEQRDRARSNRSITLRIYSCDECGGYHLTSNLDHY